MFIPNHVCNLISYVVHDFLLRGMFFSRLRHTSLPRLLSYGATRVCFLFYRFDGPIGDLGGESSEKVLWVVMHDSCMNDIWIVSIIILGFWNRLIQLLILILFSILCILDMSWVNSFWFTTMWEIPFSRGRSHLNRPNMRLISSMWGIPFSRIFFAYWISCTTQRQSI